MAGLSLTIASEINIDKADTIVEIDSKAIKIIFFISYFQTFNLQIVVTLKHST